MSVCSAAVGVLSLIAVVHILLSIALGGLIAFVCYYGRLKRKDSQTKALNEDSAARQRSRALLEIESPDKLYLSAPEKKPSSETTTPVPSSSGYNTEESDIKEDLGTIQNRWTVSDPDFSVEEIRKESFDKPAELSTSVEVKAQLGDVVPRKRSRISMTSIASNLSNRFRKSVDLDSEDALRLMRERSSSERDSSERDNSEGLVITLSGGEVASDRPTSSNGATVEINFESSPAMELDGTNEESEC